MAEADNKNNPPPQQKGKGRLNIKVNDDVAKGTYANLSIIHNSDAEFVLDFVFVEPQRRQGHVVSRIVTTPRATKRLLVGLTELVRLYEDRFGPIDVADPSAPKSTYH
ncbi:MAG: DUF3467 domain-containing protein [Myxococcota bacterium]|nr:DUF3467 domain-containing protein [Myxococcota bacterium]